MAQAHERGLRLDLGQPTDGIREVAFEQVVTGGGALVGDRPPPVGHDAADPELAHDLPHPI